MAKIKIKKVKIEEVDIELPVYLKRKNNKGEDWLVVKIVNKNKGVVISDVMDSVSINKNPEKYLLDESFKETTKDKFDKLYEKMVKRIDKLAIDLEIIEENEE